MPTRRAQYIIPQFSDISRIFHIHLHSCLAIRGGDCADISQYLNIPFYALSCEWSVAATYDQA